MENGCGYIKKERERESLREAGRVFLVFSLRARLPSLPPAQEARPRAGEGGRRMGSRRRVRRPREALSRERQRSPYRNLEAP